MADADFDNPEVVTREERIKELEGELGMLKGGGFETGLMKAIQNPGLLRQTFNLNEAQTGNVKALIAGAGSAASVKYFGKAVGDVLAAAAGGAIAALVAKKLLG